MESFFNNLTSSQMNVTEGGLYCGQFVGPVVWCIFTVPCAGVGLPACMWLLWLLIREKTSGSASAGTYTLNLTVMDLIFNIILLPMLLNLYLFQSNLFRQIGIVMYSFNVSGRPLLTACICADCYMAVLHPITYMRTRQSRYAVAVCVLVWCYTIVTGATWFIENISLLRLTAFIVALPTITFCDVSILCALRKPDPSGRNGVHPQKQRAMQTITNSLVMSIVAYLPPLVLKVASLFAPLSTQELVCNIMVPSEISSMLGSTIMPLMHLSNTGKLQNLWKKCVAWK